MVFTSDDFHPYRHLKKSATRMRVLTVKDLTPAETHTFLSRRITANGGPPLDPRISSEVWNLLGGRLSLLGKLADQPDMVEAAKEMVESEKGWLLHHLGLIPDHDDDVMGESFRFRFYAPPLTRTRFCRRAKGVDVFILTIPRVRSTCRRARRFEGLRRTGFYITRRNRRDSEYSDHRRGDFSEYAGSRIFCLVAS